MEKRYTRRFSFDAQRLHIVWRACRGACKYSLYSRNSLGSHSSLPGVLRSAGVLVLRLLLVRCEAGTTCSCATSCELLAACGSDWSSLLGSPRGSLSSPNLGCGRVSPSGPQGSGSEFTRPELPATRARDETAGGGCRDRYALVGGQLPARSRGECASARHHPPVCCAEVNHDASVVSRVVHTKAIAVNP